MPTNINGFTIFGAIEQKWLLYKSGPSPLGVPLGNETPTFDDKGRYQEFANGTISWHPDIVEAFVVRGLILRRWLAIGRERFGYPTIDESITADGAGRYSLFRALHLSGAPESIIFWNETTGTHEVFGAIFHEFKIVGWESGPLGYPIGPELPTFDGEGRSQEFRRGVISWHPRLGAYAIWGPVVTKWRALGKEQFGYPIHRLSPTQSQSGSYITVRGMHLNDQPDSTIITGPRTPAFLIYGAIRDFWEHQGREGTFGFPTSDERNRVGGGRVQDFERRRLAWDGRSVFPD